MRQTKNAGTLVDTYVHPPTGATYEIRFKKTEKKFFARVGAIDVVEDTFDACQKKVADLCEKQKLVVWTPVIQVSYVSDLRIRVDRFEAAVREDGVCVVTPWDIEIYPGNGHVRKTILYGVKTDQDRATYAHQMYANREEADRLLSTLAAGKVYVPKQDGTYPGGCVYVPYSENAYAAASDLAKVQEALCKRAIEAFTNPERRQRIEETGDHGIRLGWMP